MIRWLPLILSILVPTVLFAAEETVVRWSYTEEWRRGTEDDDLFFGMVVAVREGPDGHLYLLDSQRNHVVVLDGAGQTVGFLGREGDGPGEFRSPVGLALLDEGVLGVVQRLPGKVILLDREGTPRGTIHAGGPEAPDQGGAIMLTGVRVRNGTIAVTGEVFQGGGYTQFLSVIDADGRELHRLLERPRGRLIHTMLYVEKDEDFVQQGRWNLGPGGRVYLAPNRDEFLVEVREPRGELVSTIEGPCRAHERTAAEIERIKDSIVMMLDGRRARVESEIAVTDPCVAGLNVAAGGELRVLTSQGARDNQAGVFQTWDVFTPDGTFSHRLEISAPGDPESDRLVLLPGGRAMLLKGWVQARRAVRPKLEGAAESAEADDVDHYVIGLQR